VFYASFDGYAQADLSPGAAGPLNPLPAAAANPFVPGLFGQALASGAFTVSYHLDADRTRQGSFVAWVAGNRWTKEDQGYFWVFRMHDQRGGLLAGRMGGGNRQALYAHISRGGKGTSAAQGSSQNWKDGDWHLLVVNWRSDSVEFSLDGGLPNQARLATVPPENPAAKATPAMLIVSSEQNGANQLLMDEVLVFNAPLTPADIQWLYESGKPEK